MHRSPTVLGAMTPFPITTGPDTQVIAARAILKGHEIRHLPVVMDGIVIGVLTEADLELAEHLTGEPEMPVLRLIRRPPVRVDVETPLKVAVRRMASEGRDAAVVEREGRLVGILTLTDVSKVLVQLMPGPFVDQGGPAA